MFAQLVGVTAVAPESCGAETGAGSGAEARIVGADPAGGIDGTQGRVSRLNPQ